MEISIEYAAGFFDGEGSITIEVPNRKSTPSWRLSVRVSQNTAKPLLALQERWGGSVSRVRTRKGYQWQISCRKAAAFLRDILPHLLVKEDSARIGLRLTKRIEDRGTPGRNGLSEDEQLSRHALKHQLQLSQRWGSLERFPLRKVGVPSV